MSASPQVRRTDKLMSQHEMDAFLSHGYCGHLSTVGADEWPYVCPMLYVWRDRQVWLHNTSATGHLRSNVVHDSRACFEVASAGTVFAYGRYECDTGIEYQSVITFGRIAIANDRGQKAQFFDALMAKYYPNDSTRPRGFYPRLDDVTVYALAVERMTGKKTALPAEQARWPAVDNTKSPHAKPPL
ncbi:MAG TPA: pyridoxamine 5'-phosphate oxidase family protein [Casimicrobiaceae bacterium]|nr:pyridoxamine 5'-phosphate oxidase family protein [Casimicrobiaceae bacterium]